MQNIVEELRSKLLDKDNMPRMKSERVVSVDLTERVLYEIEKLEYENRKLNKAFKTQQELLEVYRNW